ncbi:hypothetical protein OG887_43735 (plasmid) [Streptomyces sp. NBC_00053]|uniref:hypothetical protein n=1 Tax=unclassified Streptomyces TaxID=2593676 RepID=UPI00225719EE|nr:MULTISPECIES: hypothetical protein [unclassified Streptomyces]MCX4400172.1 hypothetical protein [Streptomyces sp. NBC_01767]MCX5106839.1 hypothetical protein [Streptomyces sp. NBC_00439]MCX5506219.1 hypothetical protein [Streptomyces sp. NBC_00052]MCX5554078.1 hypothetical protein [Streptomyces sp. NBC_00051]
MELSDGQAATLGGLLQEGSTLDVDSDLGNMVRWRTAVLVYLRGTLPPEHHVWNCLRDIDQYELPYGNDRPRNFALHWGPLLGVLQGLFLLHAEEAGTPVPLDEEGSVRPESDASSEEGWWPMVLAAVCACGPAGMRTSVAAEIAQRDRKTVRTKLQAAVQRGELSYRDNGPYSVYVHAQFTQPALP